MPLLPTLEELAETLRRFRICYSSGGLHEMEGLKYFVDDLLARYDAARAADENNS